MDEKIVHLPYDADNNEESFDIIVTESGEVLFPRGIGVSKDTVMEIVAGLTSDEEEIKRVEQFLDGGDKVQTIIGEDMCG